ncbi:hypothetical protein HYS47_05175 [Candidatus Woesearchaeota archaeon]|nr:hypothetical protein [Candidatus Woesearchaeota archaeon]
MFIVIYGINNIGKSTQAKWLVDWLNKNGYTAEYLKYPIYHSLTGQQISGILRSGKKQGMDELAFQTLYYQNRKEFEPELRKKLGHGIIIVAEDYIGTSLAWGSAKGADYAALKKLNSSLLHEDLAILLDGIRFTKAIEKGHLHESDAKLVEQVRRQHIEIGKELDWKKVDANPPVEKVSAAILAIVKPYLFKLQRAQ